MILFEKFIFTEESEILALKREIEGLKRAKAEAIDEAKRLKGLSYFTFSNALHLIGFNLSL